MPETPSQTAPCWIRPDGTYLPAPEGLAAPIHGRAGEPSDPTVALASGWVGARPAGDVGWWEILQPTVATTKRACHATGLLVRRKEFATPKPLAAALASLARCSWDSDRYANPETALAAGRSGVLSTRIHDAIAAVLARSPADGLAPDTVRIDSAQAILDHEVSDLYETAHAWRYGPSLARPADGRWSEDPSDKRAGARAAAGRVLASARRMEGALLDARLAALGLDAADVPPPPQVEPIPGEAALAALFRLAHEREADMVRFLADKASLRHPTDALPAHLRPAAKVWTDALTGTGVTVSNLRAYAESYLCQAERIDPADDRTHQDLASHLISHECGRTALELRHRIRRVLPVYVERLREAIAASPMPGSGP